MCYIRGTARDYDDWAAQGADGWDWAGVLPYFKRAEGNTRGGSDLRGGDGPLTVSDLRNVNPLSRVFIEAGQQAGLPRNNDFNGPSQLGVGLYQVTQRDGARCSTAVAYLNPAKPRPNLSVHTGTMVERILFEGARATGVACSHRGKAASYRASREVILSGGSINSPQLLMLSGIGPEAELRRHGIAVVPARAGVGANLPDPLPASPPPHATRPPSYDPATTPQLPSNSFPPPPH